MTPMPTFYGTIEIFIRDFKAEDEELACEMVNAVLDKLPANWEIEYSHVGQVKGENHDHLYHQEER